MKSEERHKYKPRMGYKNIPREATQIHLWFEHRFKFKWHKHKPIANTNKYSHIMGKQIHTDL